MDCSNCPKRDKCFLVEAETFFQDNVSLKAEMVRNAQEPMTELIMKTMEVLPFLALPGISDLFDGVLSATLRLGFYLGFKHESVSDYLKGR